MSVYRIRELLDRFHELLCRGCDYAEVHINEESDPAFLSLSGTTPFVPDHGIQARVCKYL